MVSKPKGKEMKRLIILSVLLLVACAPAQRQVVKSIPTPTPTVGTTVAPTTGLNKPFRDGKFEFTVTKMECGKTQIGGTYLNKKAQGQFCLVTLNVKNIGNEARMLDSSSQEASGPNGVKYKADGVASMYANPNNEVFLNEINPGNQVVGIVVFDIPKDARIIGLELHDSSFSDGVRIVL